MSAGGTTLTNNSTTTVISESLGTLNAGTVLLVNVTAVVTPFSTGISKAIINRGTGTASYRINGHLSGFAQDTRNGRATGAEDIAHTLSATIEITATGTFTLRVQQLQDGGSSETTNTYMSIVYLLKT